MADQSSTYASAGVDINAAQRALRGVREAIGATHSERVIGGVGHFGAMYAPDLREFQNPVLVTSIDGVGTKTKVAHMMGSYAGLGTDLVNHCVNDILCQGAKPLFFLDYFGCSHLDPEVFEQVVIGASDACGKVGCALVGGETAEMPGVYVHDEIDLVGSIVGMVDFDSRLPRSKPKPGDRLVGIASNGLHTNGYSLARRVLFELGGLSVRDGFEGSDQTIGEALLTPHQCYFKEVYPLLAQFPGIYALAHITGGGLPDNLPRILPTDLQAVVLRGSWTPLPIFRLIQEVGSVPQAEMDRTFNMGIGMVAVVDFEATEAVIEALNSAGLHAAEIGKLQSGPHDVQLI